MPEGYFYPNRQKPSVSLQDVQDPLIHTSLPNDITICVIKQIIKAGDKTIHLYRVKKKLCDSELRGLRRMRLKTNWITAT